ncbi:hypothetical protein BGZ47_004034, partial [Haplosporangium gracile]
MHPNPLNATKLTASNATAGDPDVSNIDPVIKDQFACDQIERVFVDVLHDFGLDVTKAEVFEDDIE